MRSRCRSLTLRRFVTAIVLDILPRQPVPAPVPRPRTWEVSYGRRRQAIAENDARVRVTSGRPW